MNPCFFYCLLWHTKCSFGMSDFAQTRKSVDNWDEVKYGRGSSITEAFSLKKNFKVLLVKYRREIVNQKHFKAIHMLKNEFYKPGRKFYPIFYSRKSLFFFTFSINKNDCFRTFSKRFLSANVIAYCPKKD